MPEHTISTCLKHGVKNCGICEIEQNADSIIQKVELKIKKLNLKKVKKKKNN